MNLCADANTMTEEEMKALRAKAKAEKAAVIEELLNRRTGECKTLLLHCLIL